MLGRGGRWLQRAWGAASGPPQPAPRGAQLSFDGAVFRLKSGWELVRGLLVFRLCALPGLVRRAPTLLSVSRRLLGHRLWGSLLRASFYGQFVAGQTPPEVGVTVQRLHALGLRPLLAVPIEEDVGQDKEGEGWYEGNRGAVLGCVGLSAQGGPQPMMQLKVTALMSAWLCRTVSLQLEEPGGRSELSTDRLAAVMGGEDCLARLGADAALAERRGFCFGVKLVRGAYLEQERRLARERGYPDPLHPTWEATNHSYERCLDLLLELVARDGQRCQLIVASHNEASVSHTVRRPGWVRHLQVDPLRGGGGRAAVPGAPGPGEPERAAGHPQRAGPPPPGALEAPAAPPLRNPGVRENRCPPQPVLLFPPETVGVGGLGLSQSACRLPPCPEGFWEGGIGA
ncbi:hydroxyproline dehydrogenase isoform X4 [Lepidochelys kempii]|uniref:hydroxyproline dehydrogenase isoform X4 n=1 Tax=Lepidochelys kempii TaxID=8472 RepID=UPI003C7030D7